LRDHLWARVRPLVGLLAGGILLWLGLRTLSWQDFSRVMAQVRWPWLILSWLTIPAGTCVKALRWRLILRDGQEPPPWPRMMAALTVGQLVDAVVFSQVGELTRAYLVAKAADRPLATTLGTIIVEKVLDGLALLGVALALALNLALPPWFGRASLTFSIPFAALLIALALLTLGRDRLVRWCSRLPDKPRRLVTSGIEGLTVLRRPHTFIQAALSTSLVWLLGLVTNYCLFIALGIPPTASGALLLLAVHYLAVLIPGVPAQVGLFHYVTVLALGALGVGRELSMPYAIVLHALIYGTMILLGAAAASWLSLDLGVLAREWRKGARETQ